MVDMQFEREAPPAPAPSVCGVWCTCVYWAAYQRSGTLPLPHGRAYSTQDEVDATGGIDGGLGGVLVRVGAGCIATKLAAAAATIVILSVGCWAGRGDR